MVQERAVRGAKKVVCAPCNNPWGMDARHLGDVVSKGTPFDLRTVTKWLALGGVDASWCTSLHQVPAQWLYSFLVHGIGASPADIAAHVAHLYSLEAPLPPEDPMARAGGFMDMRRVRAAARRLPFALPFSHAAYENPSSPFFRVGHPHTHKEGTGWYKCGCWKCN